MEEKQKILDEIKSNYEKLNELKKLEEKSILAQLINQGLYNLEWTVQRSNKPYGISGIETHKFFLFSLYYYNNTKQLIDIMKNNKCENISFEERGNVILTRMDGGLKLTFTFNFDLPKFIKKNNLNVNFKELQDEIIEIEHEIKTLKGG